MDIEDKIEGTLHRNPILSVLIAAILAAGVAVFIQAVIQAERFGGMKQQIDTNQANISNILSKLGELETMSAQQSSTTARLARAEADIVNLRQGVADKDLLLYRIDQLDKAVSTFRQEVRGEVTGGQRQYGRDDRAPRPDQLP